MSIDKTAFHKTYPVSWDQLHWDCRSLANKLREVRVNWSRIIAVARGGLIPAAVIAKELNVRLVDTICISTFTVKDNSAESILKRPDLVGVDSSWLIIDDIVDDAETAKLIRDTFGSAHFATLYVRPGGVPLVDNFVTAVDNNTWVLLPWETSRPQY